MNIVQHNLTFIIFFSLVSVLSNGQTTLSTHFTTKENLPSDIVYDICQDETGYLWIATQNGVVKFDGMEFNELNHAQEIKNRAVIKIIRGNSGIYLLTYDGLLFSYDDELLLQANIVKLLPELAGGVIANTRIQDNIIWINDYFGNLFEIDFESEKIRKYPFRNFDRIYVAHVGEQIIYAFTDKVNQVTTNLNWKSVTLTGVGEKSSVTVNYKRLNERYMLIINDILFEFFDGKALTTSIFNFPVSGYFEDENERIISTTGNGIHYTNYITGEQRQLLNGTTIRKIIKDIEGGYWMIADNKGLFYFPSFMFSFANRLQNSVYKICKTDNSLFFVTDKNEVGFMDQEGEIEFCHIFFERKYLIEDILAANDNMIWLLCSFYKKGESNVQDGNLKAYQFLNKDGWILIDSVEFQGTADLALNPLDTYRERYLKINFDKKGEIAVGSLKTYAQLEGKQINFVKPNEISVEARITDNVFAGGYNIFSYLNKGIASFDFEGDIVLFNAQLSDLLSNYVKCMFALNEQTILIGTNKGLSILKFEDKIEKNRIINYNDKDGLIDFNINDIDTFNNHIYLATNKGFITFNPDFPEKKKVYPKLKIDQISINERDTVVLDKYYLRYDENNITIHLKAVSLKYPENLMFRYKLNDAENWKVIKDQKIELEGLQYQEYEFVAQVSVDGKHWSEEMTGFCFSIRKPFSQTILFWILIIIFTLSITIFIAVMIIRNMRKQYRIRNELLLSEQKALRAQMDPHFIFNSLNSIRRFAVNSDRLALDNYISDFSNLIRKILHNSSENQISIQDEIEFLELYLKIEKIRIKNDFEYQIETEIEQEQYHEMIPSMLLQPLIENAIWHGLMPKENERRLLLGFYNIADKYLKCVVEDNGIGRKKSNEINKNRKKHKSFGLNSVSERIDLLNKTYDTNVELCIIDLYNENEAIGTRIEIKINY